MSDLMAYLLKLTGVNPVKVHRIIVAALGVLAVAVAALQFVDQNLPK